MIYRVIQGFIVALLSFSILSFIRAVDLEHQLPQKTSWLSIGIFFMAGLVIEPKESITTILFLIFMSYLGAMAYTDWYTKHVYTFFSLFVSMIGYVSLLLNSNRIEFAKLLFFISIVLFCWLLHTYAFGDVELFFAMTPYGVLLAEQYQADVFFLLLFLFCLSIIFGILGWIIERVRKKKIGEHFAIAPGIYAVFFILFAFA